MFDEPAALHLPDAHVIYTPHWISPQDAAALSGTLRRTLHWQQQPVRIFGKLVMQPRLTAWYGDAGAAYTYSGLRHEPLPFTPELQQLRLRLESHTGQRFNSVLCNLYRNGTDSMGWHSDNEPELGPDPVIASISLGQTRRFVLRHKNNHSLKHTLPLETGSLLLMHGLTQQHWQHGLPRSLTANGERINLTFRLIHTIT
ncbi:MAG: alpha-ketoglutarate-dependent dioxygenase AlkB [Bacteroidia bacterium]|jgi:alkylated DNA repair dioxygenase AlkB|nr:alpha-ketoglutarate-dependent dioxygenase AlkB [Bacteroidia bacterium]